MVKCLDAGIFSWSRNGDKLPSNALLRGIETLVIPEVDLESNGFYICHSFGYKEVERSVYLKVVGKSMSEKKIVVPNDVSEEITK